MKSSLVRRVALACTSLTVLGTGAYAADLPVKAAPQPPAPVYSWTGFYVGLHAGAGTPTEDTYATMQRFTGGTVPHPLQSSNQHPFVFGGGQAGYGWKFGDWVAGLEADVSIRSAQSAQLNEGPITMNVNRTGDVFGTVRGRFGWLWNQQFLTYVTGGLAYGRDNFSSTIIGPGPVGIFNFSNDNWRTGWVAGAGIEMALDAHWSAKVEYQYVALSDLSQTFIQFNPGGKGNSGVFTAQGSDNAHTVRLGLNYHFWGM